jgi:hypothetical protein
MSISAHEARLARPQSAAGIRDSVREISQARKAIENEKQEQAQQLQRPQSAPSAFASKKPKEGLAQSISEISGKILSARGLHTNKVFRKGRPRCIVKGIRQNSTLVTLFETKEEEGRNPVWNVEWSHNCVIKRDRREIIGLKFMVYDKEDFLGGVDVEITEQSSYYTRSEEFELTGIVLVKEKGKPPRKARLFVEITIQRSYLPIFDAPYTMLLHSMPTFSRVISIVGRINKTRGLKCHRGIKSRICFMRCFMLSGKILDFFHTSHYTKDSVEASWDEIFEFSFTDESDQPLMLMVDVWGAAGKFDIERVLAVGEHLGTAMIPVDSLVNVGTLAEDPTRAYCRLTLSQQQRFETRLDKSGVQTQVRSSEFEDKDTDRYAKRQEAIQNHVPLHERFMPQFLTKSSEKTHGTISLEFAATREEACMPHVSLLMEDERVIVDEDDLMTEPDAELQTYFDDDTRFLSISGENRIAAVYGRILSAEDLVNSDVLGKSDPYAIVEGVTKSGQAIFIHRTRVIQDSLCPKWNEAFVFTVPPDPDDPTMPMALSKIQFSIFDSDEGEIMSVDGDDPLGSASCEISFMRNEDVLEEELPLLGIKSRPGGYVSRGCYKRYSTVAVEIRVERRVFRDIQCLHDRPGNELIQRIRHIESRPMAPPEVMHYSDASQEPASDRPDDSEAARQVMFLRDTGSLLERGRSHQQAVFRNWMRSGQPPRWLQEPATSSSKRPKSASSVMRSAGQLDAKALHRPHSAGALVQRKAASQAVWMNSLGQETNCASELQDGLPHLARHYRHAPKDNWDQTLQHSQADPFDLVHLNRRPPIVQNIHRVPMAATLATRFGSRYEGSMEDPIMPGKKEKMAAREWGNIAYIPPDFEQTEGACLSELLSENVLQNLTNKPPVDHLAHFLSREARTKESAPPLWNLQQPTA